MNEIMYIRPYHRSCTGPRCRKTGSMFGNLSCSIITPANPSGGWNVTAALLIQDRTFALQALVSFEAAVNLIPERAEIVNRRDDGEKDNDIKSQLSVGFEIRHFLVAENQKCYLNDLRHHLNLAEFGSTDGEALS